LYSATEIGHFCTHHGVDPVRRVSAVASGARETISAGIMFAVIRTGGKQYRVAKDDVISVEKLAGEPGATVELAEVLMIGEGAEVATGTPLLEGASVAATVVEQTRGPKIIVFKKKRRHNYRRKKGHRQQQTVLRIAEIRGAGGAGGEEGVTDGA
jgi:large subunit ribosomal protein L21